MDYLRSVRSIVFPLCGVWMLAFFCVYFPSSVCAQSCGAHMLYIANARDLNSELHVARLVILVVLIYCSSGASGF